MSGSCAETDSELRLDARISKVVDELHCWSACRKELECRSDGQILFSSRCRTPALVCLWMSEVAVSVDCGRTRRE